MVEVGNNSSVVLVANQTIPFNVNTFDTNDRMYFEQSTNSIVITKVGKYEINGRFVFVPSEAKVANLSVYANGQPIPFDYSSFTVASGITYNFNLPSKIINAVSSAPNNVIKITFQSDTAGTMTNAIASVKYVE